jgi:S-DNA-T family DNA segregation ATPase FtsK/SpoIIIE
LKRSLVPTYLLAGLLCGAGVALLGSLLAFLTGVEGLTAAPGRFLFSTFLWSSFFVPVYPIALAVLLLSRRFSPRRFGVLNLLLLPFVTVSLFHKVALHGSVPPSFLPDLLVANLGRFPASVLLFALIVLELLLVLSLRRPPNLRAEEEQEAKKAPRLRLPAPLEARRPEALAGGDGRRLKALEGPKRADEDPEEAVELEEAAAPDSAQKPAPEPEEAIEVDAAEDEVEAALERAKPPVRETAPKLRPRREAGPAVAPEAKADRAAKPSAREYRFPTKGLLKEYHGGQYWEIDDETRHAAEILMKTLEEFKITAEVTGIRKGPVITMYEVLPSAGVKVSRIAALSDNIALRLAASRVRIVAPIPGKHAVGIEVPNKKRAIVSFKEMIDLPDFQTAHMEIPVALGKDIAGAAQVIDLTQTPHLLIAGATGSGKSVCVNSIICSILYKKSPADVRFILVDPKIVELKSFNDIPHLLTPVVTEPKRTYQVLEYCLQEMERRYGLLDHMGVRDIRAYNKKAGKLKVTIPRIPYWVIVIDEFADLIATTGKEMEAVIARLAAMARAVGLHLVLATQRPSIEVITGLIKANIPSRIAFMVASKFDSRIIIDAVGAEKLLGQGDMLFSAAWDPVPVRLQGTYLSDEEVEAITTHAKTLGAPDYLDEDLFLEESEEDFDGTGADDPLMDEALQIVLAMGKASASYLQRRLKIGYNRAARLVEEMERMGVVGPSKGSKARDVLRTPESGLARPGRE